MSRSQYCALLMSVIVSSVLTAVLTTSLLTGYDASAAEIKAKPQVREYEKVIRVQRLEVVDSGGTVRATLGLQSHASPSLILYDEKGKLRAMLRLSEKGKPELDFLDEKGALRALLRLTPSDNPVVVLQDNKGKARAILGSISPGDAEGDLPTRPVSSLVLLDEKEKPIWRAP